MALQLKRPHSHEVVAFRSKLIAIMMQVDRESSLAMQLLASATRVGSDIRQSSKDVHTSQKEIRPLAERFREARVPEELPRDACFCNGVSIGEDFVHPSELLHRPIGCML